MGKGNWRITAVLWVDLGASEWLVDKASDWVTLLAWQGDRVDLTATLLAS